MTRRPSLLAAILAALSLLATGAMAADKEKDKKKDPEAIGDREVWYLYAMGDATNGFEVRPVKLSRD